ncbi:type IV toxin-antitoxin system AbiEi family antitoxin domain-containing protein [Rhodoferax sp.]|uniref:type IV toxin-antitoxin system AbiEi family antitoxin domain-containing protein n=1 Tax=Rhodoferax sp. TaxID=50421 RepID=UPI002772731A|nr:type IV toxin-antitoxin system AbiEi family antitoxin [Rhodoferax sp.]
MQSPLTDLLDAAERRGKLNLRTADIAQALPGVSAQALRQALHRQQRKGRIVHASRGSEHWVIVPLQDASAGAPPLETWLDAYLSKTLGLPYYIGLLSAAEAYGASPQAVMVTQVMVPNSRRPLQVGRHRLVFLKRARTAEMPTRWRATPHGRFKISTPELTALDLVSRQQVAGGIARITDVLRSLVLDMTANGLLTALNAAHETPTAQRLGVLLSQLSQPLLTNLVADWLGTRRTRKIPLTIGGGEQGASTLNRRFKVNVPASPQPANT